VGDALPAQAGKVIRLQELRIAHLHGIAEIRREGRKKRIQAVEKLPEILKAAFSESTELENHQRCLRPMPPQRPQEHLLQHLRIQKLRVRFARLRTVTRVFGKDAARDLLRRLERKPEAVGHLRKQLFPELFCWELVKSEVTAHGGKGFGVLAQAGSLEQLLRKAAPHRIARPRINLVEPPGILPGTSAYEDVPRSQIRQPRSQPPAVDTRGLFEQRACVESAHHAPLAR